MTSTTVPAALPFRIGQGYDCHALVAERKLIIGGVDIPHKVGLLGHSDADIVLHAVADALLGAAGLGDIGEHFPDTAPECKDMDSSVLLAKVVSDVHAVGWSVVNADIIIHAQAPKLLPYKPQIRARIAAKRKNSQVAAFLFKITMAPAE